MILRLRKELTDQGLDAGADTIRWHLEHHHGSTVSRATINRYLGDAGLVDPEPKKRPKASYIRFQADLPNECWQSDFTHYRLTHSDGAAGTDVEILSWLDDCARYALGVTAHRRVSGPIVAAAFRETVALHGIPASTLTDIQSGCAALGLPRRPASQDRCRPAPARRRCLTDRSARRLLAC